MQGDREEYGKHLVIHGKEGHSFLYTEESEMVQRSLHVRYSKGQMVRLNVSSFDKGNYSNKKIKKFSTKH